MQATTQHTMFLERTLPSGQEEWSCPTCGRRFLLKWPPSFKKTIIVPGDESVAHCGAKGTPELDLMLIADPVNVAAAPEDLLDHDDSLPEETLTPWLKWLQQVEFGDSPAEDS